MICTESVVCGLASHPSRSNSLVTHPSFFPISGETDERQWLLSDCCFGRFLYFFSDLRLLYFYRYLQDLLCYLDLRLWSWLLRSNKWRFQTFYLFILFWKIGVLQFGIRAGSVPALTRDDDLWDSVFSFFFNIYGDWEISKKKVTSFVQYHSVNISDSDLVFFCMRRPSFCLFSLFLISGTSSFIAVDIFSRFFLEFGENSSQVGKNCNDPDFWLGPFGL